MSAAGNGTTGDAGPVNVERLHDGTVWRVSLATPKANVLDAEKVGALRGVFREAASARGLKAVIFRGEGPHFSFGASVEEHLPGRFADMLAEFHGLFGDILEAAVPCVAAVRGRCLGGGLELAAFCHRLVADPNAQLGQPEIRLGVFPPVASVILKERIRRPLAEELCLTGRSMDAREALEAGLVDQVAEDPDSAALGWVEEHLQPLSAAALHCAVKALRRDFAVRFREEIRALEALYRDELMATSDAEEGLRAFLEKRRPEWRDS